MFKYSLIAVAVLTVACGLLTWRIDHLQNENNTLTEQIRAKTALIATHEKNVKITEEVANAYQNDINKLNADLDRLRRQPANCIPITSSAGRGVESTSRAELSDRNGITDQRLYEYAGRAEQTRLTLLACQNFINRVKERQNNE